MNDSENLTQIVSEDEHGVLLDLEDDPQINEDVNEMFTADQPDTNEQQSGSDWIISLNDNNQDVFEFKEFDKQTYRFQRIFDPNGNRTNYHSCHCKDEACIDPDTNEPTWITWNGMLSSRYKVANLEKFVSVIQNQGLPIDPSRSTLVHCPFYMVYKTITPYNIEIFDNDDTKLIFGIITGAGMDDLDGLSTSLGINIVNSYNGSSSLRVEFTLNTDINIEGTDHKLVDYFTLTKDSSVISHLETLRSFASNVENVVNSIENRILILKNSTENLSATYEKIKRKFKHDAEMELQSYWEGMPDDYYNYFYLLILTSIVLNKYYDVKRHIELRATIEKCISPLYAS